MSVSQRVSVSQCISIDLCDLFPGPINQTLPFIPMHMIPQMETEDTKERISDGQQSPLISTLEQREDEQKTSMQSTLFTSVDSIIPITIDINSKPSEEVIITKVVRF